MKIVITGASGFIGRALVISLAKNNHEIVALARNPKSIKDLPCDVVEWDFEKTLPIVNSLLNVDAFIHLAGESIASRWTEQRKKQIYHSRIHSTQKIIEFFKSIPNENRPKTFISTSAIGFYGNRNDELLDESSPGGTGFLANVCKDWEVEASKAKELQIRSIIFRLGVVLGKNGGALSQMKPITLGSGRQWMSWVHQFDVVEAIQFAMNHNNLTGVFNLTAPNPITNQDFTKKLAQYYPIQIPISTPKIILKIILGEMSSMLFDSQNVSSKKLQESGFQFKFSHLNEALNNLIGSSKKKVNQFESTQFVKKNIKDVFNFFSAAENLETITPPFLCFKVLSKSTPNIQKGTIIQYKLKIHHIPVKWITHITEFEKNKYFIDSQEKGPYKKWVHRHSFEEIKNGTLIHDQVDYIIPAGILGQMLLSRFIKNDIQCIFSYRKEVIERIFK